MRASRLRQLVGLSAILAGFALSCRGGVRRFPLADPMWIDPDTNHVPERPDKYYSGLLADGADQMVLRPLAYAFALPVPGESINVNSMDEVPNSSWFTNRIGYHPMTPDDVYKGACGDAPPLSPDQAPWTVVEAKPNGANPGFFIKAGDGRRYLLKFDSPLQPTRATGADVLGSKLYHAAGYWTPCNEIVFFRPNILKIDPEATAENSVGEDVPITDADIDKVLSSAFRTKDGILRASASRFVPGRPIGPFKYEGTRSDDPNDVIDHQDRRELRGSRILAAWINHFDSREQNSLNVWVNDDGREYVRHYFIDWGDSLGGRQVFDQISRRLGRSYYWDWNHFFTDLITLGLIPRTWNRLEVNPYDQFGYFDGETFTASKWKAGYPNPAHDRMSTRDALWMVRIISNIEERHVRAMVRSAKFPDPRFDAFLVKRLMERRQRIFEEYLTVHSPLANFQMARRTPGDDRQSFCFENLALKHGVADLKTTYYKMRFRGGAGLGTRENLSDEELGWLQFNPDPDHPHRACVVLPVGHRRPADLVKADAPDDDPLRYGILDIFTHQTRSVQPTSETRVHFYDLGPDRGFRLVGIERPEQPILPDLY